MIAENVLGASKARYPSPWWGCVCVRACMCMHGAPWHSGSLESQQLEPCSQLCVTTLSETWRNWMEFREEQLVRLKGLKGLRDWFMRKDEKNLMCAAWLSEYMIIACKHLKGINKGEGEELAQGEETDSGIMGEIKRWGKDEWLGKVLARGVTFYEFSLSEAWDGGNVMSWFWEDEP